MNAAISKTLSRLLTSKRVRDLRRTRAALTRRLRKAQPTVHYFHQDDDPYSVLAVQLLPALAERYAVAIRILRVSPPSAAAAPDAQRLRDYAVRDAALLASHYELTHADAVPGILTDLGPVADRPTGDALRARLGHYLGAMLHFEGEWYWGIDRLHFLEQRLRDAGLAREPQHELIITPSDVTCAPQSTLPDAAPNGTAVAKSLHFFASLRSPYTYLAVPRAERLAAHYGAALKTRYVLPMVMRGLPVPTAKRRYIMLDAKREAERLNMPFGVMVDPVGVGVQRGYAVLYRAIELGVGPAFALSFLRGAFAEGIDTTSLAGLQKIAARAGIDATTVHAALKDGTWRGVADQNRQELLALGFWGVPSVLVDAGGAPVAPAVWGQDRLWAIEAALRSTNVKAQSTAPDPTLTDQFLQPPATAV